MAGASSTFSESWYRVANQKICLRPGVDVIRQSFRGERWMVLQNPLSNEFFRVRPEVYEFIARLRSDRTVEEVWKECLEKFPETSPGQEQVVQLLAQLYHANLLHYEVAPDTAQLFERYKKRKQQELGFRWLNIMFMRFPLLDPDRFLLAAMPMVRWLFSPVGVILWLAVVGLGVKTVIENFPALRDQTQGVLAPGNLFWLYCGLVILKTLHEFGHAFFCRKYGGEVHTMGIMLMIFTPVPFVDATSSWSFRSKRERVMVGLAGMIVEFFVAAIAAIIWSRTAPGILHSVCFNMMFVASVSTLIFNINPLMRFDGYYIMADLLEIANLNQRSMQQWKHIFERYLFGVKQSTSPGHSKSETAWLTVFGITAIIYRTVIFAGIILFIANKWLLLGALMAVICLVSWICVPIVKLTRYLGTAPQLSRVRPRAVFATLALIGGIIAFIGLVPLPHHFRASGVMQSAHWSQVVTETNGEVMELIAAPGKPVKAGQPLFRMENPELDLQMANATATYKEIETRWRAAMQKDVASLKPLQSRLESAKKTIERISQDKSNLVVRARYDGIWVAPGVEDFRRRFLQRGTPVGLVVDPGNFEFSATVLQEDVDRIFKRKFPGAEVRLFGETGEVVHLKNLRVVPGEQKTLPSPALGFQGGGDVATNMRDQEGRTAAEPFFSLVGDVAGGQAAMLHGRTGKVRFDLGYEPLLPRWWRQLTQLLQKRFQI